MAKQLIVTTSLSTLAWKGQLIGATILLDGEELNIIDIIIYKSFSRVFVLMTDANEKVALLDKDDYEIRINDSAYFARFWAKVFRKTPKNKLWKVSSIEDVPDAP